MRSSRASSGSAVRWMSLRWCTMWLSTQRQHSLSSQPSTSQSRWGTALTEMFGVVCHPCLAVKLHTTIGCGCSGWAVAQHLYSAGLSWVGKYENCYLIFTCESMKLYVLHHFCSFCCVVWYSCTRNIDMSAIWLWSIWLGAYLHDILATFFFLTLHPSGNLPKGHDHRVSSLVSNHTPSQHTFNSMPASSLIIHHYWIH